MYSAFTHGFVAGQISDIKMFFHCKKAPFLSFVNLIFLFTFQTFTSPHTALQI